MRRKAAIIVTIPDRQLKRARFIWAPRVGRFRIGFTIIPRLPRMIRSSLVLESEDWLPTTYCNNTVTACPTLLDIWMSESMKSRPRPDFKLSVPELRKEPSEQPS